ncbi:MAG: response regulator [Bacteroidetes bacterium]|nr:response regulator [Bacteroidota bacterium]
MKKLTCILLVDDNPADNTFHKINIKESGTCEHVEVAADGKKALEYLIHSSEASNDFPKPDIIFLDINMPKMDGFEFLEEYKKLDDKIKSRVLIIMLSTSLNPDDQKRALLYDEIVEFQNKPLETGTLKQIVDRYF